MVIEPLSDTDAAAGARQVEMLRTLTTGQRMSKALALSDFIIRLSKRAIRRANPGMSDREVRLAFVSLHYGEDVAARVGALIDKK